MKKIELYLFFIVLCFFCGQGNGLAETMYVSDRLYLSLRNAPDLEKPSVAILPSDTKVEVLQTEDNWAEVTLEDGRTGWVMKKFLVRDLPKSLLIEELKGQVENKEIILGRIREENASLKKEIEDLKNKIIHQNKNPQMAIVKNIEELKGELENKDLILERLQEENASLKEEISDLSILKAKEAIMKKEIEELKNEIVHQKKKPEMTTEKNSLEKRKIIYGISIGALIVGLIIGYLVRRPKKNRFYLR